MHIVVLSNDVQKNIILQKKLNAGVTLEFAIDLHNMASDIKADAAFILFDNIDFKDLKRITTIPVIINSVIETLRDFPANFHRVNAWPTFFERDLWEVASKDELVVNDIFDRIGWRYVLTPDEPGFIAARIIAMIINEAYFAFEDGVSDKEEINVAMKLGTNYPFGPFEWADKIGVHNIVKLLKALGTNDRRYIVSKALEEELLLVR